LAQKLCRSSVSTVNRFKKSASSAAHSLVETVSSERSFLKGVVANV
jgi:hypothetical protein